MAGRVRVRTGAPARDDAGGSLLHVCRVSGGFPEAQRPSSLAPAHEARDRSTLMSETVIPSACIY